jgi:hypothetical protein
MYPRNAARAQQTNFQHSVFSVPWGTSPVKMLAVNLRDTLDR